MSIVSAVSANMYLHERAALLTRTMHPCILIHTYRLVQINATTLQVAAGAVSWPHPEKVKPGIPKAVNRKHGGHAGEDAYFCRPGRWELSLLLPLACHYHNAWASLAVFL